MVRPRLKPICNLVARRRPTAQIKPPEEEKIAESSPATTNPCISQEQPPNSPALELDKNLNEVILPASENVAPPEPNKEHASTGPRVISFEYTALQDQPPEILPEKPTDRSTLKSVLTEKILEDSNSTPLVESRDRASLKSVFTEKILENSNSNSTPLVETRSTLKSVLNVPWTKKIPENSNSNSTPLEKPVEILVPQIKLGADGQIIVDDQNCAVISQAQTTPDETPKIKLVKKWNKWETMKFYKALSTYGTNFSLMQTAFADRGRDALKNKFKAEEKVRCHLVDKVLKDQVFDEESLKKYFEVVDLKKKVTEGKTRTSCASSSRGRCRGMMSEVGCESVISGSEDDVLGSRVTVVPKIKPQVKKMRIKGVEKLKPRGGVAKGRVKKEKKYLFTCYL